MSASDPTTSVEFRPVEGCPGYEIGSDGTVWVLHNTRRRSCPRRQIKGCITRKGYVRVMLQRGAAQPVMKFVHDLVLTAFVGPRPAGMEACHWDGNKRNNRLDNLRWDTSRGNSSDSKRLGTTRVSLGSLNPRAILTESEVAEIKRAITDGAGNRQLARFYGVTPLTISKIRCGRTWAHVSA